MLVLLFLALYRHVISDHHCGFLLLEAMVYGPMVVIIRFRHDWIWIGYAIMTILLATDAVLETLGSQ
jgi:hypothetical protein